MKILTPIILGIITGLIFYRFRNVMGTSLSKNFTLAELTRTNTGIPNDPEPYELINLNSLANQILQPIRDRFGATKVTSGFRSKAVNDAVGGVPDSDHRKGLAGDIVPLEADIDTVFNWIKTSGLPIKQAIIETGSRGERWIHISLATEKREPEFLTAKWNPVQKRMDYARA